VSFPKCNTAGLRLHPPAGWRPHGPASQDEVRHAAASRCGTGTPPPCTQQMHAPREHTPAARRCPTPHQRGHLAGQPATRAQRRAIASSLHRVPREGPHSRHVTVSWTCEARWCAFQAPYAARRPHGCCSSSQKLRQYYT
jgi:hypothetical protein